MSDLLKEALADAKAVRATALANAKVALEEAFGERIQAMFAERLKNEVAEEENVVSSEIGHGDNMKPKMEEDGVEEITDADLAEIIAELEKDGGLEEEGEVDPTAVAPVAPAVPSDPTAVAPMAPVAPADPNAAVPCDPTAVAPMAPVAPADPNAVAPMAPVAEDEM